MRLPAQGNKADSDSIMKPKATAISFKDSFRTIGIHTLFCLLLVTKVSQIRDSRPAIPGITGQALINRPDIKRFMNKYTIIIIQQMQRDKKSAQNTFFLLGYILPNNDRSFSIRV